MEYKDTGVDYDAMDPFKRKCQLTGRNTAGNITRFGLKEAEWSRGESCYLVEAPWGYLAHVEEGLGTKNIVADAVYQLALARQVEEITGISQYQKVARCTVAMIVNDMITLGALPISIAMHLATGDKTWFADERRSDDLIAGFEEGCNIARCVWGGGETPTLIGIVVPGTALLSGSGMGIVMPKERVIKPAIRPGTVIMLLASSGPHANGYTMFREIAGILPKGYETPISDGRAYGEALLDPTNIYVGVVEDCMNRGVRFHYTANITGHGWRKLMRATEPFVYVIDKVPEPQPVFQFIQEHGPVSDFDAYKDLNMGAGFALFIDESDVDTVTAVANANGVSALRAGYVEKNGNDKRVIIRPKDIEFGGKTLAVR